MTAQTPMVISIIAGTAPATECESAATRLLVDRLTRRPGVRVQLLELRDFPLPLWGWQPSEDAVVRRWRHAIARSDGFIFLPTSERDGNAAATLMNAFDWGHRAWKDKAAAFLSSGDQMSWRLMQQLRANAMAARMIATRSDLRISAVILPAGSNEADETIDELLRCAQMLKATREDHKLSCA